MDIPPEEGSQNKKIGWALLPDLLKKGVLAGIGALFMTEEGARSILGELKLPKEAAQFVLNQVSKTKEDLFGRISNEIRSFLESVSLSDEFRKVLATTSLQISTTIRFVDEGDSLQPRTKSSVRIKSTARKKKKAKKNVAE
jgi:hypothetical protein